MKVNPRIVKERFETHWALTSDFAHFFHFVVGFLETEHFFTGQDTMQEYMKGRQRL